MRTSLILFAVLLFVTAVQADAADPAGAPPLWTQDQLQSTPKERHAGAVTAPDRTPPARLAPVRGAPPLPGSLRGSIRRVDTGGEKLVALTFDLCELSDQKTGYDGDVVDALRRLDASATFFAGGKWMRSHPERAMQLMASPRFEVGSHAWTHGNFGVLDEKSMREQILWTQAQYELLREEFDRRGATSQASAASAPAGAAPPGTGTSTASGTVASAGSPAAVAAAPATIAVFRFPYGRCRPEALALLAQAGIAAIQWDVNTMDAAASQTAPKILQLVERTVKPGSIILMHANGFGVHTAEAVGLIVPALRGRGYRLVTVSQLLAAGKPVAAAECYDSRPGDTAIYDRQFGDGTVHAKNR